MKSPFPDQYIDIKGNKIRYWQVGDTGEHLILIHGLGSTVEYWQYVLPELAKHYRVLVIDLLGSGKSDKPDIRYSLDFYSGFLKDVVQAFQLQQVYLAAHSLGGGLALKFSVDHRNIVKKVFLIDNAGFDTQVTYIFRLMSFTWLGKLMINVNKAMYRKALEYSVYDSKSITDEFVEQLYPLASQPGHRRTMLQLIHDNAGIFGMHKSTWAPMWAKFDVIKDLPIFVIWGEHDKLLNIKNLKSGQRRLPHLQSTVFKNCGHMPQIEYPERTAKLMIDFLVS